jgi:hypothetical protein
MHTTLNLSKLEYLQRCVLKGTFYLWRGDEAPFQNNPGQGLHNAPSTDDVMSQGGLGAKFR